MLVIPSTLIKEIADHHDASPTAYRRFSQGEVILETAPGGLTSEIRGEHLGLSRRTLDVVETLECVGITEAKLPIGDGSCYVIVRLVRP